jgi:hypothetical protein
VAYSIKLDDRDPSGDPFPTVQINDGPGIFFFGSEDFQQQTYWTKSVNN